MLGWIFFALLLVWYVMTLLFTAKKSNNLENYAVMLLLDDEIRNTQSVKLKEWCRSTDARDAAHLSGLAGRVIGDMADLMGPTRGAPAMLWHARTHP